MGFAFGVGRLGAPLREAEKGERGLFLTPFPSKKRKISLRHVAFMRLV